MTLPEYEHSEDKCEVIFFIRGPSGYKTVFATHDEALTGDDAVMAAYNEVKTQIRAVQWRGSLRAALAAAELEDQSPNFGWREWREDRERTKNEIFRLELENRLQAKDLEALIRMGGLDAESVQRIENAIAIAEERRLRRRLFPRRAP